MNIYNHKFIIFGSYGANALGQIRGLGEKGIKPIAILVGKNSYRIDKSKYISELYDVSDIEEGLNLLLLKFGTEPYKPFLFTDRDDIMGLLDSNYDTIKNLFYLWNAGKSGRLSYFLNKVNQIKLAEECGFRIPQTEIVNVGEMPYNLTFPIFTKAADSLNPFWKGEAHICYDEHDLKETYKNIDSKQILLQEYIEKESELPLEGISLNGGEELVILGRTVYCNLRKDSFGTYRYVEPYNNMELELKIKKMIKSIHYTGAFEIEFIVDKNKTHYFLEINFRIAQQNYGYVLLGANIPYICALSMLEGHIIYDEIKYIPQRKVYIMHEFEDFKYSVIHKEISLVRWMRNFISSDCYSFFNIKDLRPFCYTILTKVINSIKCRKK